MLVRRDEQARCPSCDSEKVERRISTPAVQSSGTRDLAMRAARKRDKAQGQERVAAQREYERNHELDRQGPGW